MQFSAIGNKCLIRHLTPTLIGRCRQFSEPCQLQQYQTFFQWPSPKWMISHHAPIKDIIWILQVHWLKRSKTANFQMFHCTAVIWCSVGQSSINFFSDNLFWTNETHTHEVTNGKVAKVIKVLSSFPNQSEPLFGRVQLSMCCHVMSLQDNFVYKTLTIISLSISLHWHFSATTHVGPCWVSVCTRIPGAWPSHT